MKKEVLIVMDVEEKRFIEFENLLKKCVSKYNGTLKKSSLKDDVFYIEDNDWNDKFKDIMSKLGIVKDSYKGYSMLENIMQAFSENIDKKYETVSQLYVFVSENHYQVDRNIRTLINVIWRKNSVKHISEVFTGVRISKEKPLSNREFIFLLKDKLFEQ